MTNKIKSQNYMKIFAVFIFLALMLFIKPERVMAGEQRTGTKFDTGEVTFTLIDSSDLQGTNSGRFLGIWANSYTDLDEDKQQYKIGYKADMIAQSTVGKTAWADYQSEKDEYSIQGLANLIEYPCIIMFTDRYIDKTNKPTYYTVTGYMYLYANARDVWEQAAIWTSYAGTSDADSQLPLYYPNAKAESGEAFLGIYAFPCYLPLSPIYSKAYGGYYSQNFISTYTDEEKLEKQAKEYLDIIANEIDGDYDVNDWTSWCDITTPYVIGSDFRKVPGDYKWVLMFSIGAMGQNTYNSTGQSYYLDGKQYSVTGATITAGMNAVSAISPEASLILKGSGSYVDSHNYKGFKSNAQLIGLDSKIPCIPRSVLGYIPRFKTSRLFTKYNDDYPLLNGEAMLKAGYEFIASQGGGNVLNKERARLTPSQIASVYEQVITAGVMSGQVGTSNFIVIPGVGNFISRYSWGATVGMIGSAQDTWFPRDTHPDRQEDSSAIIGRKLPGIGVSRLKTHQLTRNFGRYATDEWDNLSDQDKIESTIIFLETDPWYVNLIGPKVSKISTPQQLNALAKTNYREWKTVIKDIGEYLVTHSLTSIFPHTGWGAQSAFCDGSYYAVECYPIYIPITVPPLTMEDLVVSNSFNNEDDTSVTSFTGNIKYATARNIICWINGGNNGDDGSLSSLVQAKYGLALSDFKKGGSGHLPTNQGVDYGSGGSYQSYDIKTALAKNPITFTNNTAKVPNTQDAWVSKYLSDTQATPFTSIFYVGRIPEADSELSVKVSDMRPVATVKFNNMADFMPDMDMNESVRAAIKEGLSDGVGSASGSASDVLQGAFYGFLADYEGSVLFKCYKQSAVGYMYSGAGGWKFTVAAEPIAIQNVNGIQGYNTNEYALKGTAATGYSGITGQTWTAASGASDVLPGSVVAYGLQYQIPKATSLESEINKNRNGQVNSLISKGLWYEDYGTVLIVDLDINLLPSVNSASDWAEINPNTANDWVRERLSRPIRKNIYFTEAHLTGVSGYSYSSPAYKDVDGIRYAIGREDDTLTLFKVDLTTYKGDASTGYRISSVSLQCSWRFVVIGETANKTSSSMYNYITYENDFTRQNGTVRADSTNIGGTEANMKISTNKTPLTVRPNVDVLNAGKDSHIEVRVPMNDANQFHKDWEIIEVRFNVPQKDNASWDLVLVRGGAVIGDSGIHRNGKDNGTVQTITTLTSGYTLYAVVKRVYPNYTWKEQTGAPKSSSGQLGSFTLNINGVQQSSRGVGPWTGGGCPMWGPFKNLAGFNNMGDYMLFRTPISGKLENLHAVFNYRDGQNGTSRDDEDMDLANNYWEEEWTYQGSLPNFQIRIIQEEPNLEQYAACIGSLPGQVAKTPVYVVEVSQGNETYTGGGTVEVNVSLDGGFALKGGSFNSAGKAKFSFGSGTTKQTFTASYNTKKFSWGWYCSNNKTFHFQASVNLNPTLYKEDILHDNRDEAYFTVNLCAIPKSSGLCGKPPTYCTYKDLRSMNCKTSKGVGDRYEWDVKFAWSQMSKNQTYSTNVYVAHYMVPDYDSEGNQTGEHEVCPCYCQPSPGRGANDGKRYWRNRDLGLGMYYEYHFMYIYVQDTADGTRTIGHANIENGENFRFWFEAGYTSNRGDQPNAKHEPFSQPYSTPNGGSGCPTCNTLSRWPDPMNVPGPRTVYITISGLSNYSMGINYTSPQTTLASSTVHKHFRWTPVPDWIKIQKENIRQGVTLSITSKAFLGHYYDTYRSVDGTGAQSYSWQIRTFHCFCDHIVGTIAIRESKVYLASSISSAEMGTGLDGTETTYNESPNKVDDIGGSWSGEGAWVN